MRTLFALLILSTTSACQVDTPECGALLSCCAGLREPSAGQCRDAYSVFRTNEHADALCGRAQEAYACRPPGLDAGSDGSAGFPDAGYSLDVGPDAGAYLGFDAGAPSIDAGRSSDAGPVFYPDAGPPRADAQPSRSDAGRPSTDAGPRSDAGAF